MKAIKVALAILEQELAELNSKIREHQYQAKILEKRWYKVNAQRIELLEYCKKAPVAKLANASDLKSDD